MQNGLRERPATPQTRELPSSTRRRGARGIRRSRVEPSCVSNSSDESDFSLQIVRQGLAPWSYSESPRRVGREGSAVAHSAGIKCEKPTRRFFAPRFRALWQGGYLTANTLNAPVGVSASDESTWRTRLRPTCFARY